MTASADPRFEVRAATRDDIESLVAFNDRIFDPSAGVWARSLLVGDRPGTSFRDFLMVEDPASSRVVASLCLLLQEWMYEGVPISVSQMELVGTDPGFRGRGLIRMLVTRFAQMERSKNCLVSCVQGTPGLYQKLGYEYAIPLKGGIPIPLDRAADHASLGMDETGSGPVMRRAVPADYPDLLQLYTDTTRDCALSSSRTAATWQYQDGQSSDSRHSIETYVLEQNGRITGYFRLRASSKANAIMLREAQAQAWDGRRMALKAAFDKAAATGFQSVLLQLPPSNPLYQAVRQAGGREIPSFAWQVRVLDWPEFLNRIAPVLEARMAASSLAGWTGSVAVRLRDAATLRLCWDTGKLTVCADGGDDGSGGVDATVGMFTQLVFGYRSSDVLMRCHPDFRVADSIRVALDTLFPERPSYVYETY